MLSILIGHSYFLRLDRKQFDRARPYPPLATLQVAARLREAGHEPALFDAMLAEGPAAFAAKVAQVRPRVVVLYEDNYNFLTKMCLATMRQACCEMIAQAHREGARVIVAGSDATDAPRPYLDAGADVVLRGEGIPALLSLVSRLASNPGMDGGALVDGLPGTVALVDDRLVEGGCAIANADEPAPRAATGGPAVIALHAEGRGPTRREAPPEWPAAWDLVDIERYRAIWQRAHGEFSLNMAASKGCSFRCNWCAKPIWGNRYQQRDASAVATEMAWLKRVFAPGHIWFADDIFGFRADWVGRFADTLEAIGGGIPFTIQTRADLVTPAMAQALGRAGCREAWIGAESGSQLVLDAMDKGTTVDEILQARDRLGAQGVRVGFFIQLGYPGEDLDELLATRRLVEAARPDDIGVSVAYPLPGTRFHERVREQLGAKTHWLDSGDLAMMFQGTFTSDFYRRFRDLLHAQVELDKPGARSSAGKSRQVRAELQERWISLLAGAHRCRTGEGLPALMS
jgi:anaerobic magnesium-protoporphyrin IX monomethyl ester cyclase